MLKIKFDPTDRSIHGPFQSLSALHKALVPADVGDAAYQAWAKTFGADPASGRYITTAYNDDLLNRRLATLEQQLLDYTGAAESQLKFTVPTDLQAAFTEAAATHPAGKPFKMWVHSNTRETLFFALNKQFPQLDLQADHVVMDDEYADRSNQLVARLAPELSQKLTYSSNWQPVAPCGLVHVNSSVIYEDKAGLEALAWVIANETGAERAVFNNMHFNKSQGGAEQWFAQRYSGGVIPFRVPARGEIETVMKKNGYRLVTETQATTTYDVNAQSRFKEQVPTHENFSFIRDRSPN